MGRLNYQQRQAAREERGRPAKPAKSVAPPAPSAAYQQLVREYEKNTTDVRNDYETNIKPVKDAYETNTKEIREQYNTNLGLTPAGRTNQSTRVNPKGVVQTGTNTGAINMPGLADMDMTGIANFNGPSFPTQKETNKITDGYSFTASEFLTEPKNEDGSAYEAPGGTPETTNIAVNGNTFRPNTFAKGTAGDIGGLDGFKPGGKFAGAPTATEGQSQSGDDDGWGAPNPADYALSGEEMRRRSAFLDADNSMDGLKAVEAGMGMKYAGGKHYYNVDGKAVAADSVEGPSAREIKNAAPGEAQALKDKWVQALKTSNEEEPQTASSAQNPTQPSGTSTFNKDEKLDLPKEASAVDFMNDNTEDDFGIGNKTQFNPDNFTNTGLNIGSFPTQSIGL